MPDNAQPEYYHLIYVRIPLDEGGVVGGRRTVRSPRFSSDGERKDYERLQEEFKLAEGLHHDGTYSAIICHPRHLRLEDLQRHLPNLKITKLEDLPRRFASL